MVAGAEFGDYEVAGCAVDDGFGVAQDALAVLVVFGVGFLGGGAGQTRSRHCGSVVGGVQGGLLLLWGFELCLLLGEVAGGQVTIAAVSAVSGLFRGEQAPLFALVRWFVLLQTLHHLDVLRRRA